MQTLPDANPVFGGIWALVFSAWQNLVQAVVIIRADIKIHQCRPLTIANLQQPSCDDSSLYGYQISLTSQFQLVTNFSGKLVTAAVEF